MCTKLATRSLLGKPNASTSSGGLFVRGAERGSGVAIDLSPVVPHLHNPIVCLLQILTSSKQYRREMCYEGPLFSALAFAQRGWPK
jgi:hypothetical protein